MLKSAPFLRSWLPLALATVILFTARGADRADRRDCTHPPIVEIQRGKTGRILRSTSQRTRFKRLTGFPKGRPGHHIDHVIPLKRGGPDCPCNMQWLPLAEKKRKDRTE